MKKITPLVIVFLFTIQLVISQNISHSTSLTIKDNHSVSCNTGGIIRTNTFYRSFDLNDFGITSSYDITSVEFGIEIMSGAPVGGYPVKVSIYTTDIAFPTGTLILINEVTETITDQSLTLYSTAINATIPANAEFVVSISIASDVASDGGNDSVSFFIGSNDLGESAPGYYEAATCSINTPVLFSDSAIGRPDIHLVMNIVGTSSTADVEELDLVSFSYHPNPVKDKLYMSAQEDITSVSLYNMLGQKLKEIQPSQFDAELDLTSLSTGTYFVRATVNDKTGSFKILKQ